MRITAWGVLEASSDIYLVTNCTQVFPLCHKPGTPAEKTMYLPASAQKGHLGHGDYLGMCATVCDTGAGWWEGKTIDGDLKVPAGATCKLSWSEVKGNTSVAGNLLTIHGQFDGNVAVAGGSLAGVNWGNTFLGNLSIENSAGSTIPGGAIQNGFWSEYSPTTIAGDFSFINNSIPLYIQRPYPTTVQGNFTYRGSPCGSTPTVLGASSVSCP